MVKPVVKICWSGGKDSTCAVMKHLEAGHICKIVCYIPMFTETIPLLLKIHYDFIMRTADYFKSLGAEVHIVTGRTYYDHIHYRSTRGKYKGRAFGFPPFQKGWCNFKRDSKLKAVDNCDVGYFDYTDIGIAADEYDRHNQLNEQKRSILCELGITEKEAKDYDIEHNLLSPHYKTQKRDGCTLCPNAKRQERELWFKDYPEALPLVIELQEFVKVNKPGQFPLRKHLWFIDEEGNLN